MKVTNLFTEDERAVSPVVGVALLIAIAVILAAVIGAVVLGLGTGGVDTPQAQLQLDDSDTSNATLVHNGGEPLPANQTLVVIDDEDPEPLDRDLTAGGSYEIGPVAGNETVVILWQDPNSDSETVLERFDL